MVPKWEWDVVKPGVLALSGTTIQIRREKIAVIPDAIPFWSYIVYIDDVRDLMFSALDPAKKYSVEKLKELLEIGAFETEVE